jgi:uncharacterized protein YcnI
MTTRTFLALAASLLLPLTAQSHVTLEQGEAATGSAYKAVMRIGHGCDGSPTREVSVLIPQGLRGAKPQPKLGWTLQVTKAPLKAPYESHGKPVLEDTVEVRWTANTEADQLQDAWFDEFVLRATAPAQAGVYWFKVRQLCTQGEWNWAEIPSSESPAPRAPAVKLTIKPGAPAAHVH